MVLADQTLDVLEGAMSSLLKSPGPQSIVVVGHSDSLEDVLRRETVDGVQPSFAEKERIEVLLILNIPNRRFRIVNRRWQRLFENKRIVDRRRWGRF